MPPIDEICAEISLILANGMWIQKNDSVYEPDSLNKFPSGDVQAVLSEGVQKGCLFKPVTCSDTSEVYVATRETIAALQMNMNLLCYAKT